MATKLAYDLVAAKGEYQDKNSGQTKKQWVNIGKMYANDNGYFLVLEPHINLAGLLRSDRGGVMVSCFEPKAPAGGSGAAGSFGGHSPAPSGGSAAASGSSVPGLDPFDDDIPF